MPAEGFIAKDLQILISLMGILFSSIMFEQYTWLFKDSVLHMLIWYYCEQ